MRKSVSKYSLEERLMIIKEYETSLSFPQKVDRFLTQKCVTLRCLLRLLRFAALLLRCFVVAE